MGDVVSSVAAPLTSVAEDLLRLAEDPITAVLPETESIFQGLSKLLGSELTPSSPGQAADQLQALELAQSLPRQRSVPAKQDTMATLVHLLPGAML